MSFKNPARRNELVKEYVDAMQTARKRNMHTREEKLAIGEELDTLFKPVVQATERAASENKKEMEELRGALEKPADFAVTRLKKAGGLMTRHLDRTGRKPGNYTWGCQRSNRRSHLTVQSGWL